MKKLTLILIAAFGFFSCKKEEKLVCKPIICNTCKYVTYVRTNSNKKEIILSAIDSKVCGDEIFKGKKTLSISIIYDSLNTRYRYEMNCEDNFDFKEN